MRQNQRQVRLMNTSLVEGSGGNGPRQKMVVKNFFLDYF